MQAAAASAASNETGDSIHKTGALRRTQKPDKVELSKAAGEREAARNKEQACTGHATNTKRIA